MKSVFIVAGRDRFRYLAFHFHTKLVSQEEIFATLAAHFSRSQRCRQHAHRGMHQQSIDAVFAHSELCVVEVVDVNRNSVGKGSKAGRQLGRGPQHGGAPRLATKRSNVLLD